MPGKTGSTAEEKTGVDRFPLVQKLVPFADIRRLWETKGNGQLAGPAQSRHSPDCPSNQDFHAFAAFKAQR